MPDKQIVAVRPPTQLDLKVLGAGLSRIFAVAEDDSSFTELLAKLDRVAPDPLENR